MALHIDMGVHTGQQQIPALGAAAICERDSVKFGMGA
jgi:hypothetical protein